MRIKKSWFFASLLLAPQISFAGFSARKTVPLRLAPPALRVQRPLSLRLPQIPPRGLALPAAIIPLKPAVSAENLKKNPGIFGALEKTHRKILTGSDPEPALKRLYGEAASNSETPVPVPTPVEEFALRAERLLFPGLAPGQHGAVVYGPPAPQTEGVPTEQEMQRKMAISPVTNLEREKVVLQLLQEAGARYDPARAKVTRPDFSRDGEIQVQEAGQRGKHNIFVVKKGKKADKKIFVTAHMDKVSEGRGTIDNWTGTTEVINLYMAQKDIDADATYVFILFAREEEGLIGSQFFLDSMPKADRKNTSVINLDTLAVNGTFSWENNSTRSLLDLTREVADAEKLDLTEATLNGGDADSSTFRRVGMPAMTLFGASEDVIFDIIHSAKDNMASFSLPHYKNAYLLTLALLKALDR